MTHLRVGLLAAVAGAAIFTGCSDKAPAAPTEPLPAVTSVSISQLPLSLNPGQTAQLTATATLSDGSTIPATALATWSTSASAILSVSPTGLLTAVAPGDATITATYGLRSITMGLSVRGGQTLQGLITETAPTTTRVVFGAQVTVADGPYQGESATTDAGGRFSLPNVAGPLNLRVSKAGFETLTLTAEPGGAEVTVRLMPAGTETSVAEFSCTFPCDRVNLPFQGRLSFNLHHSGSVTVSVDANIMGGESWPLCGELRTADNQVIFERASTWQAPFTQTVNLAGGKTYQLSVYSCPSGGPLRGYRLTAIHPS